MTKKQKNIAILNAVNVFGKGQSGLADAIGVSRAVMWQYLHGMLKVSITSAINIEKQTNRQVTCEELRPDIDWAFIRNGK